MTDFFLAHSSTYAKKHQTSTAHTLSDGRKTSILRPNLLDRKFSFQEGKNGTVDAVCLSLINRCLEKEKKMKGEREGKILSNKEIVQY